MPDTLQQRATRLAALTADAYSYDRYRSWRSCARMLLTAGYGEPEAEAILRSKWTRWAADAVESPRKPYGRATGRDLLAFVRRQTPADLLALVTGGQS
jgi:hypothetical protein